MRKADVFPSKYLKAEGLALGGGRYGTLTLTIESVSTSEPFDDGKVQRVLHFKEDGRELGLNATNWDTIAYITGKDDDDHWGGSKIELYVDPHVRFGGKIVPAIRVRAPQGVAPVGGNFPNGVNPQVLAQAGMKPAAELPLATKGTAWAAWKRSAQERGDTGTDLADRFKKAADIEAANSKTPIDNFGAANWANVAQAYRLPSEVIAEDDIPF